MANQDAPADPLITLRIARLQDRIAALEAGYKEIGRGVDTLVEREKSKPKLRVVKGGDDD